MSSRPSIELVGAELSAIRKVVSFSSRKAPDEILNAILENPCGRGAMSLAALGYAGSNTYVPTSSTVQFSVENGEFNDGRRWIVLRVDGTLHLAASGIVISPSASGSDIQVLKADKRKVGAIKESVENGTLFCRWREFDYPYD